MARDTYNEERVYSGVASVAKSHLVGTLDVFAGSTNFTLAGGFVEDLPYDVILGLDSGLTVVDLDQGFVKVQGHKIYFNPCFLVRPQMDHVLRKHDNIIVAGPVFLLCFQSSSLASGDCSTRQDSSAQAAGG